MNENQTAKAIDEKEKGRKATLAFDSFIAPFIKRKREELFVAFQNTPILNADNIMEIKRMMMTLEGLEIEIQSIVDTGKMATKQLEDDKDV